MIVIIKVITGSFSNLMQISFYAGSKIEFVEK